MDCEKLQGIIAEQSYEQLQDIIANQRRELKKQESQKIAMTAPVQQKENQKIAMTAPVQQQLTENSWKISFVMPSKYKMDSLPVPNNDRVRLKEIFTKKFVVIEFSGTNSNENLNEHENELMNYIERKQIQIIGSPKYAFYNAPWTLPFLRRNEVMIEIKDFF